MQIKKDAIVNINNIKNVNIEDKIIKEAVNLNASDIHFEPDENKVNVRIRINGDLIKHCEVPLLEYPLILSRIKVKCGMNITEKRKPQDGSFSENIYGNSINFRVSTILLNTGEKIVIRIINFNKHFESFKELNFSNNQKNNIKKIINISNGLVLIVGPTGSGKTQTLYSIIGEIKKYPLNITSLEDPVEIKMNGINQVDLSKTTGVDFKTALKTLLRQDSEVIVIGEIRDSETASIASGAALTGHKIYSTIHAKSAYEVLLRLRDMNIDRYIVNNCIAGVICQRLVKILCDNCKIRINTTNKKIKLYKSGKCDKCNNTGYISRELVASVHYFNSEIKDNINDLQFLSKKLNNSQMKNQILKLLLRGKVSYYDYIDFIEKESL